jgi:hypothetical protein
MFNAILLLHMYDVIKQNLIYKNKDGNPSTKSTRHVEANVNTRKENQGNQNNSNEMEDIMLKMHLLP